MKKYIQTAILTTFALSIIYFFVFASQNYIFKKTFQEYNGEDFGSDSYLVRCNYNIFKPGFAYTFYFKDRGEISFEKPGAIFSLNKNVWKDSYTGGTTVRNTTFPQLLKMVKEDCYQFQKSKGDRRDKTINWSYGKYTPEAPKTPQQILEEQREEREMLEEIQRGEAQPTVDDIEGLEFIEKK